MSYSVWCISPNCMDASFMPFEFPSRRTNLRLVVHDTDELKRFVVNIVCNRINLLSSKVAFLRWHCAKIQSTPFFIWSFAFYHYGNKYICFYANLCNQHNLIPGQNAITQSPVVKIQFKIGYRQSTESANC